MLASTASQIAGVRVVARAQRKTVARGNVVVRAADDGKISVKTDRKDLYFGGMGASDQSLSYLDGTLPGDRGFDPLGVSDPEGAGGFIEPSWLSYAEVIHCRFAMLGAAGCFAPEFLGKAGVIPKETGLVWFKNGVIPPLGTFDYWADPFTLTWGSILLMSFAEHRRLQDYRNPGSMGKQYFLGLEAVFSGSGNPAYPGGQFFNLANFGSKGDMDSLKAKEIENGRLAMTAMLGFFVQAMVTGDGPYANLQAHLSDPVNNNILSNMAKIGGAL